MNIISHQLGSILVELNFITEDQLDEALNRQKDTIKKTDTPRQINRVKLVSKIKKTAKTAPLIGEILIKMGVVSKKNLETALNIHGKRITNLVALGSTKLGIVVELCFIINSSLDFNKVMSCIMKYTNQVTNSEASTLMLMDDNTGELVFSVPTGPKADTLKDIRLPPGAGIAGWVAKNEQHAIVPDTSKDTRFYSDIDNMTGMKSQSILCVPLKARTKLIGVLEVINKKNGAPFNDKDVLLLSIFAQQAALALENATFYASLQEQFKEQTIMKQNIAQNEKLQAIGTLAGGIAHDFNNLLTPILGYVEILMNDHTKNDLNRNYLLQIQTAATRARELSKQILTFSKQNSQETKPIQCQDIILEATKLLRASIPKSIEIIHNIDRNCGTIIGDPIKIHQIIINLGTNAFHAMEQKGGELTISLRQIEFSSSNCSFLGIEPGDYALISVSDTGAGMSEKTQKRIFEPYFTTKKKEQGTGLGLSVTHGIVQNHNGYIQVDSTLGKGTTIKIYFPITKHIFFEEKISPLKTMQQGNEHILIVDDEPQVTEVETLMLERLGYKVTSFTNSIEALEVFKLNPAIFDIIITDLTMPHMSGRELAKKIYNIRPIPIILCTGFNEVMSAQKAADLGIKKIVLKPLNMQEISITIRKALNT
jgi:signal transduction histidine kinase